MCYFKNRLNFKTLGLLDIKLNSQFSTTSVKVNVLCVRSFNPGNIYILARLSQDRADLHTV